MNKTILSICIPTYNRAECLKQCLNSITQQFNDPEIYQQVEVVISDNASSDNTEEAVGFFRGRFSNVVYVKNEYDVGYDKNALQVIAKAQGVYAWLLGDDDGLLPGSLKHILPILSSNKFDYLLANGWGFDKQLKSQAVSHPYLSMSQNLEFAQLSEYVRSLTNHKNLIGNFGGMSAQIFKRQIWLDLPGKENFIGYHVIHLFIILRAFKDLSCCVIARPMYMGRSDNMRWGIFPGLETLAKRARTTQNTLSWILKEYNIKYSPVRLWVSFVREVVMNSFKAIVRKYILKSQKSRDLFKKILRKL